MASSKDMLYTLLEQLSPVRFDRPDHNQAINYYLAPDGKSGVRTSNQSRTLILFGKLYGVCSHLGHVYQSLQSTDAFWEKQFQQDHDEAQLTPEELDFLVLNSPRTVINSANLQDALTRILTFGLPINLANNICENFNLPTFKEILERDDIVQAILLLKESGLPDGLVAQVGSFFDMPIQSLHNTDSLIGESDDAMRDLLEAELAEMDRSILFESEA